MERKPIDRGKKSNRRCWNCAYYKNRIIPQQLLNGKHISSTDLDYMSGKCPTANNKPINYWNCCKYFQWNPDKVYTEPLESA